MAGPFRQRPPLELLNSRSDNTAVSTLGIVITEQGEDFLRGTMPVDGRTRQPCSAADLGDSQQLSVLPQGCML